MPIKRSFPKENLGRLAEGQALRAQRISTVRRFSFAISEQIKKYMDVFFVLFDIGFIVFQLQQCSKMVRYQVSLRIECILLILIRIL